MDIKKVLTLLVVLSIGLPAVAAAPSLVPVQGLLADPDGVPLEGDVSVVFSLYDSQGASTALWSESQEVSCWMGLFSAYLGSVTPLDLTHFRDQDEIWLGIQVSDDNEMPRILVGSTPYSGFAQYSSYTGGEGIVITPANIISSVLGSSIDSDEITDGTITGDDIADDAVTGAHITDGAVTGVHIAAGAVTGAHIADGTITGNDIADDAVTGAHIANGAITGAHITSEAVTGNHIADGTITSADIENGSILREDLAQDGCQDGQLLQRNSTEWACADPPGLGMLSGQIDHGQTIPLPAGFTQDRCHWIVSTRVVGIEDDIGTDRIRCYADANRVVTCTFSQENESAQLGGSANYLIICQ